MNIPNGYTEYDGSGQPAETIGRNIYVVLRIGMHLNEDNGPLGIPAGSLDWEWGTGPLLGELEDIVAYKLVGEEL